MAPPEQRPLQFVEPSAGLLPLGQEKRERTVDAQEPLFWHRPHLPQAWPKEPVRVLEQL